MQCLSALAALVATQVGPGPKLDMEPRFVPSRPLAAAEPILIDRLSTGHGIANQLARQNNLQGRMLWVDCTANIDRYDSDAKLADLTAHIVRAGFNTVVLDVKSIAGLVNYRSELAPPLLEWKGKTRDPNFDVLAGMLRHAKPKGLSVLVSLNAFSEGHKLFKVGPGYQKPDQQTTIYEPDNVLRAPDGAEFELGTTTNAVVPGKIAVFTVSGRVPNAVDGFAMTVRPNGVVVDGFANGGIGPQVPTVPTGGSVLYGAGAAAEFLRQHVKPGDRLSFSTRARFVKMADWTGSQYPLMMNPNNADLVNYELAIVREVVSRYAVDGVLYDDRLRYAGINADFSEESHQAFETFVGQPVKWPEDVYTFTLNQDLTRGILAGRLYDQWMAWRAIVIRDYVQQVRKIVKMERPTAVFGAYVGSWYGEYGALGHNYADPALSTSFWYASDNYRKGGTARLFDLLIPGCYYPTATIHQAMATGSEIGRTVESSANLVNALVNDQAWTYAGIALSQFKDNPEGLASCLQAATASSQGVMVFDLSHDIEPMWPVFEAAFAGTPAKPPHTRPDVLVRVRKAREAQDKARGKSGAIPVAAGASGTGQ